MGLKTPSFLVQPKFVIWLHTVLGGMPGCRGKRGRRGVVGTHITDNLTNISINRTTGAHCDLVQRTQILQLCPLNLIYFIRSI
jgi:hypothetical protein